MATMVVGGLWHGAGWTFVAWGGLHGVYLTINRAWQQLPLARRLSIRKPWRQFSHLLTFLAVVVAWVFFRAGSFATAMRMLSSMSDLRHLLVLPEQLRPFVGGGHLFEKLGFVFQLGSVPAILKGVLWIVPLLIVVWAFPNVQELLGQHRIALAPQATRGYGAIRSTWRPNAWVAVIVGALIALAVVLMNDPGEFLYYQF
jgi:hypothetical protein